MGKLKQRYENFQKALNMLNKAIENYLIIINNSDIFTQKSMLGLNFSDLSLAMQESITQRFKYSVDLYWKYLKDYLEVELKIVPHPSGPKNIIRECTKAEILSEHEGIISLEMIDYRNMTSHIYREEIAQQISVQIPQFYVLMKKNADTFQPN